MTAVFPRAFGRDLPVAVEAEGCWITDADGRRYLDGGGGAIVVNIGHGDREVAGALARQAERVAYVHGTAFTTEALESYAAELAPLLPMDSPRVYPVSGGSEAVETALKLARVYHLARGEQSRHRIIARWGSYHGNTRGALDASGRRPLRAPYDPWLGAALHVPPVYEYRCPWPRHPEACGVRHAEALERAILEAGPDTVAAFIAEPVAGAAIGAAVPPGDYWTAVADVCRRHGVLLVADEIMTGFGRTGAWFGSDHWEVRPDILVAGKGASGGYWPLGLCVAGGEVFEAVREGGFVHGFTYSHHAVGAAVGRAVLDRLRREGLVERSRVQGELLLKELTTSLADHPHVGDVRGLGLMIGVELVRDRSTRDPFPREERVTEAIVRAAFERGLLLYSST
ncbi:MAG: aminotransferase class III-fold pyridoxal phosphate-dependent enzyme, partial [Actinobacteria bacterium]|nr:aminotransferase class III-fold pyridoxal phosphate-dependent enzyme [Actinomycetota bacterium]